MEIPALIHHGMHERSFEQARAYLTTEDPPFWSKKEQREYIVRLSKKTDYAELEAWFEQAQACWESFSPNDFKKVAICYHLRARDVRGVVQSSTIYAKASALTDFSYGLTSGRESYFYAEEVAKALKTDHALEIIRNVRSQIGL